MREAILYDKLEGNAVRCHVCQWRCRINEGKLGVCKTRLNRGGVLYTLIYEQVSSAAVDPIEKKPLFHFYPATQVFSLGTWGCNFHCLHCQNYDISYAQYNGTGALSLSGLGVRGQTLSVKRLVALTQQHDCAGIAWTYNEPTIWFEYTLEGAQLAKEKGLYTAYVTNGYITAEALDMIGPYLDAYRVDIKGFTDAFYQKLAKIPSKPGLKGILEVAVRAKDKWNMHVEVVTNVIPDHNDDTEQLQGIAGWVRDSLGALTPWHVTRFYPHAELSHLPPTPIATLERAHRIGQEAGLAFVYLGNVPGSDAENTYCYRCRNLVVRRTGYTTRLMAVVEGGHCRYCGSDLNIRGV